MLTPEQQNEILLDPRITILKDRFEAQGINFDNILNKQIGKISAGIGNKDVKGVADIIIGLLEAELRACIAKNAEKGIKYLWNKLISLFKKKTKE